MAWSALTSAPVRGACFCDTHWRWRCTCRRAITARSEGRIGQSCLQQRRRPANRDLQQPESRPKRGMRHRASCLSDRAAACCSVRWCFRVKSVSRSSSSIRACCLYSAKSPLHLIARGPGDLAPHFSIRSTHSHRGALTPLTHSTLNFEAAYTTRPSTLGTASGPRCLQSTRASINLPGSLLTRRRQAIKRPPTLR